MEFNEKLQELRKEKGLTQEELAQRLYVSRAAVSKWESGRGYPGIDSLKAMASFFGVTIDEMLTGKEALGVAEEERRRTETYLRDLVFVLLDLSAVLLLFLPLFRQQAEGFVQAVSLVQLTGAEVYMRILYYVLVGLMAVTGIVVLAMRGCRSARWERIRARVSLGVHAAGVLLLINGLQPYAATLLFVSLVLKVLLLLKWR